MSSPLTMFHLDERDAGEDKPVEYGMINHRDPLTLRRGRRLHLCTRVSKIVLNSP